jgi:hypothetical protein
MRLVPFPHAMHSEGSEEAYGAIYDVAHGHRELNWVSLDSKFPSNTPNGFTPISFFGETFESLVHCQQDLAACASGIVWASTSGYLSFERTAACVSVVLSLVAGLVSIVTGLVSIVMSSLIVGLSLLVCLSLSVQRRRGKLLNFGR